ncbi:MAG: TetR family transcriptional regulator [Pseudomonadota bacterium]
MRATLKILIDEGYKAISLRKIAAACGMKVGNVTYYFATKDQLIQETLDATMVSYAEAFAQIYHNTTMSPEKKMTQMIVFVLEDIQTRKTTRLFPELWALANNDTFVAGLVERVYEIERSSLRTVINELNPDLDEEETQALAIFVSSSLEGTTMFAGYEKPWTHKMPWLTNIAIKSLVSFVKSATSDDIRGMPDQASA